MRPLFSVRQRQIADALQQNKNAARTAFPLKRGEKSQAAFAESGVRKNQTAERTGWLSFSKFSEA